MATAFGTEITDLVREAQGGSNEAARILFEKYRKPVLYVIRQKLDRRLRRIFDSQDFLQEAFAKAFAQTAAGGQFETAQGFVAYLKMIAANKVRDATRKYLGSQRSNISNDVPWQSTPSAGEMMVQQASEETTFSGMVKERLRTQLEKLPPANKAIVRFWLNGGKPAEIAQRFDLDVKFVYRCIESIKRRLPVDKPPPNMQESRG